MGKGHLLVDDDVRASTAGELEACWPRLDPDALGPEGPGPLRMRIAVGELEPNSDADRDRAVVLNDVALILNDFPSCKHTDKLTARQRSSEIIVSGSSRLLRAVPAWISREGAAVHLTWPVGAPG